MSKTITRKEANIGKYNIIFFFIIGKLVYPFGFEFKRNILRGSNNTIVLKIGFDLFFLV